MYQQLSKYGVTSVLGTAAHYVVMYLLLGLGTSPVFATFIGAFVGALVNFLGCRRWVFDGTTHAIQQEAGRFAMTSILSLVTNTTLVWSLTPLHGVWVSQLLATLCCFFLSYLINRYWTFSTATHTSL